MNEIQVYPAGTAGRRNKKKTKGNRIADLHEYVSSTSTALVKYLPPVIRPKYDAFGKRISTTTQTTTKIPMPRESVVMRLVSSIQDKTICETSDFFARISVHLREKPQRSWHGCHRYTRTQSSNNRPVGNDRIGFMAISNKG
jgi:hypothetical protein